MGRVAQYFFHSQKKKKENSRIQRAWQKQIFVFKPELYPRSGKQILFIDPF
jgi:hypothetical protein